jgi:pantoate kinase
MNLEQKKVIVKVPHRISGFFEIVDEIHGKPFKYPVKIGSRGAGFNLNAFGITKIKLLSTNADDKIFINDTELNEKAETTHFIVNYIKKFINRPINVEIHHKFDFPVGCGYGASGVGALGTIFGLSKLLKIRLSEQEKIKIAHISEVINRTGLGTVCGQITGGLCILKEPGFPCSSEKISIPKNLIVVCGTFGIIHTKSILNDPIISGAIKKEGKIALEKLIQNPNINNFIESSMQFVKNTKITYFLKLDFINELMDELNKLKIMGASMNQLGRSVYAICDKDSLKPVLEVFETFKPKIKIFQTSIYEGKTVRFI